MAKKKTKQVLILLPVMRNMEDRTWQNVLETIKLSDYKIGYYTRIGDGLISRVRNELGRLFLEKKEYDYLMWIDSDIAWEPKTKPIDRLIESKKDIICGIYPVRDITLRPAIRTFEIQELLDKKQFTNQKAVIPFDQVFEIIYASAGFLLLSRKCVKAVYQKHKFPFQPIEGKNGEYLSEDWAFCHRAREMGYKVWADSSIKLGHIGNCIYTLDGIRPMDK